MEEVAVLWLKRRSQWSGACALLVCLVSIALLSLGGCGGQATDRYSPSKNIVGLPNLKPVAIYRFVDRRGKEENLVGERFDSYKFEVISRLEIEPIRAGEAAAKIVTRAFRDGLRGRGFPVIDMTETPFAPGESWISAKVAVSGEVLEYWESSGILKGWLSIRWIYTARSRVLLQTYGVPSGQKFWEKLYSSEVVLQAGNPRDEVLAKMVEEAMNDPELVRELARRARAD